MNIDIKITELRIETNAVAGRKDNIRGFYVWKFISNVGDIIVRGGTIREKRFGTKTLFTCEPPLYGSGYHTAFFIDNKKFYQELCIETINKYAKQTGSLPNNVTYENDTLI